jgi:hypothetical protein
MAKDKAKATPYAGFRGASTLCALPALLSIDWQTKTGDGAWHDVS